MQLGWGVTGQSDHGGCFVNSLLLLWVCCFYGFVALLLLLWVALFVFVASSLGCFVKGNSRLLCSLGNLSF